MKWKVIAIIAAVIVVTGIGAKLAIDRLFSLIFLSRVVDMGPDLKNVISTTLEDNGGALLFNGNDEPIAATGEEYEPATGGVPNADIDVEKTGVKTKYNDNGNYDGGQELSAEGKPVSGKENEEGNAAQYFQTKAEGIAAGNDEGKQEAQDRMGSTEGAEVNGNTRIVESSSEGEIKGTDADDMNINIQDEEIQDKGAQDSEINSDTGNEESEGNSSSDGNTATEENTGSKVNTATGGNDGNEGNTDVERNTAGEENAGSDGNAVAIDVTKEKIEEAEKKVSTVDKLKALDIIFRKLKASDLEILIGLLRKGKLTEDDINTAKSIIKERVTEEEKEVLKELFNKYEYLIE
mgnify:CR=1 FL=1